ncbi:cytochrome p450 [Stylonychia lemnae]|uniref:Cytochrome p450 n=1 Tax=Stylonychia lemnae TaxID=5949 RepID=A0A078A565_STYLE|nr:cytochrome p450 [Stylonychia lemnae]|eukprot:CDW76725.1 cytochrome p450 [Stylonychia lemnae]
MFFIYLLLALLISYFVWDRYIRIILRIKYYEKQGVKFHEFVPFFGSYPGIMKFIKEKDPKRFPTIDYLKHCFGLPLPLYTGFISTRVLYLYINSHEPLQELFVTKNKYFDKHPSTSTFLKKTVGDSTLFMKSNELWAKKRRSLSASLYKQKLVQMVETMKQIGLETIEEWGKRGEIDIVTETANLMMKNTLACVFGRQNENPIIKYKENGQIRDIRLGESIQQNLSNASLREFQLHLMIFPELLPIYITKHDKELEFNLNQVIDYIKNLIRDKKEKFAQTGQYEGEDLLTIMLQDELFKQDDRMIIDECLTFFNAGAQTTAVTLANFLSYIAQNSDQEQKMRNELQSHLKNFGGDSKALSTEINMEKVDDLLYLKYCFYESMRIEPPVVISSSCQVNKDLNIQGVTIKKDEALIINIYQIHHNQDQWIEDEKYIPERFDPASKYYLTPAGTPRNPLSFIPFIGGKRICLGKTFSEYTFKIIVPLLLSKHKFRLVNQDHITNKPQYDAIMFKKPVIPMRLEKI